MIIKSKESYRLEDGGGFLIVKVMNESHCPICQAVLTMRARRERVWWLGNEDKQVLLIRRLFCEECERIHHEIPDCLVPYKRYSADVIEEIINDTKTLPCPASTASRIRGWWNAVKVYFFHILMTLVERFGVIIKKPPAFKERLRAVANSNNWIYAHQVCTRSVNAANSWRVTLSP